MGCKRATVLITGAAGNLGSLLAKRMLGENVELRLMIHKKDVDPQLGGAPNVSVYKADLSDKSSLGPAVNGTDVIVHFAGVLFRANPEKFLPQTNVGYFRNLLEAAVENNVQRIILISFPHVEGESSPDNPAIGRLDAKPVSAHARTRLEEEKLLFDSAGAHGFEAVSLRVGMVYGRGILMIDAARWFSRHWLLGVWNEKTWIHLISARDFADAATAAVMKENITGIYHLGDEGVQTLQEFLDKSTTHWGTLRPWRMPLLMIYTAAYLFETYSRLTGAPSPLTRDFITIGRVSYYGDTARMRSDLLPRLTYPTFSEGIDTM